MGVERKKEMHAKEGYKNVKTPVTVGLKPCE